MALTDFVTVRRLGDYHDGLMTKEITPIKNDKADKAAIISHSTSSATINPNVLNVWGEVGSLTITFAPGIPGLVNEYNFQFTCPLNAGTVLTLPSDIRWADENELEPEPGKTYQVSILNNLAIYAEWEAASV